MKECWEKLERKRGKATIVSIDAKAMYPWIKLPLVKQTMSVHTKNLSKHAMIKTDLCLRLIGFGMTSTLLNFQEKY